MRSFDRGLRMPRKSPFRIELSVDESAELNRRATRYTLPYFEVIRPNMILMAANGMDNGSSHRGEASIRRLTQAHPTLVPIHGPIHASWLNQIEIYFSIVQRKVLTPNDFPCLEAVAERLTDFERHFESIARPFEWKFTRTDLNALIARMRDRCARDQHLKLAA